MPQPSESATLYGDKAELFREIQDDLEERWGYEPSNAETVAYLMRQRNQGQR
jgi:hypothetical protein